MNQGGNGARPKGGRNSGGNRRRKPQGGQGGGRSNFSGGSRGGRGGRSQGGQSGGGDQRRRDRRQQRPHGQRSGGRRSSGGGRGKKRPLPTSTFVQRAKQVEEKVYTPEYDFQDFVLHEVLNNNIARKGFTAPSEIQDRAIPLALEGRDVVGISHTGSGKTAAFMLPVLNEMLHDYQRKAIVLAPTRELAQQIQKEARELSKGKHLNIVLLIGGVKMNPQIQQLRRKADLVIGTPGRIKDHLEQGTLKLNGFKAVVLDEVDRMLDMGFRNDIRSILSHVPEEGRHSLFFSATMTDEIQDIIKTYSHDAETVKVDSAERGANIDQSVEYYSDPKDRVEILKEITEREDFESAVVFMEMKFATDRLVKELEKLGVNAVSIHGNKSQSQRRRALDAFTHKKVNVLVATDVAARGIDIDHVSHVINYDTPTNKEDYTHRIGRTGRAGRPGQAITFVSETS